ncbi:basic amino acid/polyamine antiporter, APA family [Thermoleophilum album]|uniref:Basic amino acid/polyamine antiporter, APA family n=1 Tax=Thermoleophilum album TaxID=29539 RepID=A0A1H6FWD3_THEAL|nr:basic amino acid/polyamine antiporter, APA family [Thermoleophilum album]
MKRNDDGSAARGRPRAERLRRGAETLESLEGRVEQLEARLTRGIGEPAIVAVAVSTASASVYFALGFVARDALGVTPLVLLAVALFYLVTSLVYLEGNVLHPERGGASTFARYAFNELISFVAGWAIVLDYVLVAAICAVAVPHYLAALWPALDARAWEIAIAGALIAAAALRNARGLGVERLRRSFWIGLLNLAFLVVLAALVVALGPPLGDPFSNGGGPFPSVSDLAFAAAVATVAATGIEAASGLAEEVRLSRRALRRVVGAGSFSVAVLLGGVSIVALAALPVRGGQTPLGGEYLLTPVVGLAETLSPPALADAARIAVVAMATLVLGRVVTSQLLGVARLTYSLATYQQVPSALGRLHERWATPHLAISSAAVLAFAFVAIGDVDLLLGLYAFGALLAFTIAHLSVLVLRFRERDRRRVFAVPLAVPVRGVGVPLPAVFGALAGAAGWVSVIILHAGARWLGLAWMLFGLALYVGYRRTTGKQLTRRFRVPEAVLREPQEREYRSILVPVTGDPIDVEIVSTAGRLAAEEGDEAEGPPMLEVIYPLEMPLSLPLDASLPEERLEQARRALQRAKAVGEEYEGVHVQTAIVRARSAGQAIVQEARRRGVEAIVLAAEAPSRTRGGGVLGGRGAPLDRALGDITRYVLDKAPCPVILTAPPAGEVGERSGVGP